MLELAKRKAREDLLAFLKFCWWEAKSLEVGTHTKAICNRLKQANQDFRNGKSTYLMIQCCMRHGKTSIASKAFPAWFLGINYDLQPDVILSGYGAKLVEGYSRRIKAILSSTNYQCLFPGVWPARGSNSVSDWSLENSTSSVIAHGIGGALTGRGGNLIVVDDTVKNIEEARSRTHRDKVWDGFKSDILTRQNPGGSIVLLIGTPWSTDDLFSRVKTAMSKDPDFPKFETLKFPARNPDGTFLFEQLLGREWYLKQYATLGTQASALLDLEPVPSSGNRFDVNKIKYHYSLNDFPKTQLKRVWDLASSDKERSGSSPDWSVGIKGTVTTIDGVKHLWIYDLVACQKSATERDNLITTTMLSDPHGTRQYIESFAAYKDTYITLKDKLRGRVVINSITPKGDKSMKASVLEPIFDSGNVHLYLPGCERHLQEFKTQVSTFPEGSHDDFVDALSLLVIANSKAYSGILI